MDAHPSLEQLEELARGAASDASAHVAGCAECSAELAWLRAERAMLARRAEAQAPLPPALWQNISARIAQTPQPTVPHSTDSSAPSPPALVASLAHATAHSPEPTARLSRRSRWSFAAVAVAAAAALSLWVRPAQVGSGALSLDASVARGDDAQDPKAVRALDRAEGDCQNAVRVLEAEYQDEKRNLDPAVAQRWDSSLSRVRTQLDGARALAGNDVEARVRVLDGYSQYLRSLRRIVDSSEEAP